MSTDQPEDVMKTVNSVVSPLGSVAEATDLLAWITSLSLAGLETLLATTYGGVLWGKPGKDGWILSDGSSVLPCEVLIDLRVFGAQEEVYVWRDATGLHARQRVDSSGEEAFTMDEEQMLWGTELHPSKTAPSGFTVLVDGEQGLAHAVPLELGDGYFNKDSHRPVRLKVRHYVGRDPETGVARVVDSRLCGLHAITAEPTSKNGAKDDTET